jgi:O-antigen/teichoic acid export membrane protein
MKFMKNNLGGEMLLSSLLLLILMNASNVLNYLFHFIMARMLNPADYGTLAVIASIFYIFSVPTASIQTIVSKYTTKHNIKKDFGRINWMFCKLFKEGLYISSILFVLFILISIFLSSLLKIHYLLLVTSGLLIFGTFLSPIGLGIFQGMKKFKALGFNLILNSSVKIIAAIILVLLGFNVFGAVWGLIAGIFFSILFIFPYLREVTLSQKIKDKVSLFSKENIPTLIAILFITLMYSLDIILAKALFSPKISGAYSVASMIGKMVFFGTASISNVMFPISSEKHFRDKDNKAKNIFKVSFIFLAALCLLSVIILTIFPDLIITVLFGSKYLEISNILVYTAISFVFLSLTNNIVLYKIAIEEFNWSKVILLGIFLVIQVMGFCIFNKSLFLFSLSFVFTSAITFIGVLLFKSIKK